MLKLQISTKFGKDYKRIKKREYNLSLVKGVFFYESRDTETV